VSFLWRRTAGAVESTCTLCGWTVRSTERDVLDQQRGHTVFECQRRRAEAAQVVEEPERIALALFNADEPAETRCGPTVFGVVPGVETGKVGSAKTNRPTRERRTVLSTPSDRNGKEAVDSC